MLNRRDFLQKSSAAPAKNRYFSADVGLKLR
jgi:hypothetical protein